jgi:hypothetical protein
MYSCSRTPPRGRYRYFARELVRKQCTKNPLAPPSIVDDCKYMYVRRLAKPAFQTPLQPRRSWVKRCSNVATCPPLLPPPLVTPARSDWLRAPRGHNPAPTPRRFRPDQPGVREHHRAWPMTPPERLLASSPISFISLDLAVMRPLLLMSVVWHLLPQFTSQCSIL